MTFPLESRSTPLNCEPMLKKTCVVPRLSRRRSSGQGVRGVFPAGREREIDASDQGRRVGRRCLGQEDDDLFLTDDGAGREDITSRLADPR